MAEIPYQEPCDLLVDLLGKTLRCQFTAALRTPPTTLPMAS